VFTLAIVKAGEVVQSLMEALSAAVWGSSMSCRPGRVICIG
jgi:hypothetical protein